MRKNARKKWKLKAISRFLMILGIFGTFPCFVNNTFAQPLLEYVYPDNDSLDSRGKGTAPALGNRNQIFEDAYEAWLDVRNAVKSGNYQQARDILDDLWAKYPRKDDIWEDIELDPNNNPYDNTDFGRQPFYVHLIFYDDLVNWRLDNQVLNRKSNQYINLLVLMPTEFEFTVTPDGGSSDEYTSTIDPKIKENDYQYVREAFSDFDEIVFYLTEGRYNLKLIFVEHDDYPVTREIEYEPGGNDAKTSYPAEMNTLKTEYGKLYSADWVFFLYPFNNNHYYTLKDEIGSLFSGGMGGYETRPFLIGINEKILYSRDANHPLMS